MSRGVRLLNTSRYNDRHARSMLRFDLIHLSAFVRNRAPMLLNIGQCRPLRMDQDMTRRVSKFPPSHNIFDIA